MQLDVSKITSTERASPTCTKTLLEQGEPCMSWWKRKWGEEFICFCGTKKIKYTKNVHTKIWKISNGLISLKQSTNLSLSCPRQSSQLWRPLKTNGVCEGNYIHKLIKKKYNCWLKILIYKRQLIKLWVWRNSKMCFIIYRPKDLSLIPAIGLVSAVLLHMRSPRINLVQGLHGVELWRCGAQRKVHWTNSLHSSTCIYPFIFQHDYKIRHVHILLLLRFSYT